MTVFFQTKSCVPKGFCRKTKKLPVSIDPVLNKTSNRYFLKCGEVRKSLSPVRWELDGEILFKSKIEQGITLNQLGDLTVSKPASRNYNHAVCFINGDIQAHYSFPKLKTATNEKESATFLRDNWEYIQNGILGQTIFYLLLFIIDKINNGKKYARI